MLCDGVMMKLIFLTDEERITDLVSRFCHESWTMHEPWWCWVILSCQSSHSNVTALCRKLSIPKFSLHQLPLAPECGHLDDFSLWIGRTWTHPFMHQNTSMWNICRAQGSHSVWNQLFSSFSLATLFQVICDLNCQKKRRRIGNPNAFLLWSFYFQAQHGWKLCTNPVPIWFFRMCWVEDCDSDTMMILLFGSQRRRKVEAGLAISLGMAIGKRRMISCDYGLFCFGFE